MYYSRYLENDLKYIADAMNRRNEFVGHPENVFLAIIADERAEIRELGLRRILKARSESASSKNIRIFQLSKISFNAIDYLGIYIPWQGCKVTEPPILSRLSDDELNDCIKNNKCPKVFPKGRSRIVNSTLQEQTSETRTQDTRTPTPHPRFMPLSLNITRIHSLHHPKKTVFMVSRTRGHTLRLRQEKYSTTYRLHFLINRIV